mmetsp:Transcript_13073/g.42839  ORF Transcript_13073/g.42839 Transcript_13073/m.42839 type:complete len:239 (-) Transcript_13073:1635-2351(-)
MQPTTKHMCACMHARLSLRSRHKAAGEALLIVTPPHPTLVRRRSAVPLAILRKRPPCKWILVHYKTGCSEAPPAEIRGDLDGPLEAVGVCAWPPPAHWMRVTVRTSFLLAPRLSTSLTTSSAVFSVDAGMYMVSRNLRASRRSCSLRLLDHLSSRAISSITRGRHSTAALASRKAMRVRRASTSTAVQAYSCLHAKITSASRMECLLESRLGKRVPPTSKTRSFSSKAILARASARVP